ncbi:MAG TPA: ERCC4 domain-containing protein [Chthoniobacter sp.]|jgi:ERCC4-type nuclease
MTDDLRPTIIIDTREQEPLPLTTYPVARGTLTSGDYSIAGLEREFAVERKTVPDLVRSLTTERERFSRELERLRGYRFARLLIIGYPGQIEMGQYRSRATPASVRHSLYAFEARYVPVVWASTPADGAALVERWAFWFARGVVEAARRLGNEE